MERTQEEIKKIITDELMKTKRDGIKELINYMEEAGFFTAPIPAGFPAP